MFRLSAHRLSRCLAAFGLAAGLMFAVVERGPRPVDLLQMNLCDSGWAGCYTGRAVAAAARVIRAERPEVVTLNEVCRGDVHALGRSLGMTAAFQPAVDRRDGRPIRCRDGEPYGIGLLLDAPGDREYRGGTYPMQDPSGTEGRAWLCAPTARGYVACTTHLVSSSPLIALAQCRHFFTTVAAAFPGRVVVGGDFNLGDLSTCRPAAFAEGSDGGLQHVAAGGTARTADRKVIDMGGTTDHPALAVTWL